MAKSTVIVDRVRSLDLPNDPYVAAQGVGGAGHAIVHLGSGTSLLDLNDPRAGIWEGILEDLRLANEPVYLETDPDTNVIKQLLYPQSVVVASIAKGPDENLHEVELEISHARHYLDTTNPDYAQLLNALTVAQQQRTPVLVTELPDDHHIIDVRPDPSPFASRPTMTMMSSPGPPSNTSSNVSPITPQQAQQLFQLVASQPYIPFTYPDDGCWGRAHEMARLILATGVQPRKVWIYGQLEVETRNHPRCRVRWGWHVAPTLLVDTGSSSEIQVLDPALFSNPEPQATWSGVQNDPNASLHDTDASVFYRSLSGQLTYDPTSSQTQQVLARYRRALALRTAQHGPPPYSHCP